MAVVGLTLTAGAGGGLYWAVLEICSGLNAFSTPGFC
jgi:hypothetical protein